MGRRAGGSDSPGQRPEPRSRITSGQMATLTVIGVGSASVADADGPIHRRGTSTGSRSSAMNLFAGPAAAVTVRSAMSFPTATGADTYGPRRHRHRVRPGVHLHVAPTLQSAPNARRLVDQHNARTRFVPIAPRFFSHGTGSSPTERSRSTRRQPSSKAARTTVTTSPSTVVTPGSTSSTARPNGSSAHRSPALPSRPTIRPRLPNLPSPPA